jgi:oligoendopeptidase F
MAGVFARVDPELGALFSRMRQGYLDLGWRQGKRGGGVERPFPVSGIPYVLVNADGTDTGTKTLMHEMGHAFHDHLTMRHTTLQWDLEHFDEFSEVASFGLYHLAAPFLGSDLGGPLTPEDAARSHARFMDEILTMYLPTFARGDAFQHWVYAHAADDVGVDELDGKWRELTARFMPWTDWRGLEAEAGVGWQGEWSLFTQPFYDIAYALSLLGSLHIWRNAQTDRVATWQTFRAALALGNTRTLPELYAAAGARLPFERTVVQETIDIVARWLDRTPG